MKAMGPIILAAILMIILGGVVLASMVSRYGDYGNIREMEIKKHTHFCMDSTEIARSFFITGALELSALQAARDNGLKGGWETIPSQKITSHGGSEYALWWNDGDFSPSMEEFKESFRQSLHKNFKKYVDGGETLALLKVKLPKYKLEDMDVSDVGGLMIKIEAEADSPIYLKKNIENDMIEIKKNADISETLEVPYFLLFQGAKEFQSAIAQKLETCNPAEIDSNVKRFLYDVQIETLEHSVLCVVKVTLSTNKKFPVWDGEKAVLEEIKLVFIMRRGATPLETS